MTFCLKYLSLSRATQVLVCTHLFSVQLLSIIISESLLTHTHSPMSLLKHPPVTILSPPRLIPSRHVSLRHSTRTRFSNNLNSCPNLVLQHQNTTGTITSYLSKEPRISRSVVAVKSQLRYPIISPDDHWGVWSAIFSIGAFGIW